MDRHPERSEGESLATRDQPLRYAQGDNQQKDTTLRVQGLPTPEKLWSVQCLNCQAALHGPFCSQCGQRAIPPHPTLRQLAGDAVDEFSGWDGRFAETLRTLFRKPGELTRQWLEGHRVRYISPWRLYLAASLAYFAVTAAAPNLRPQTAGGVDLGPVRFGVTTDGTPSRVAEDAQRAIQTNQALTGAERDSALADIADAPAILRPMLLRAVEEPASFKNAISKWMPNVFLGLIPVLGLILALFYRRRNYPEHLYFAIHLAAFVFIARTLGNLALFTHSIPIAGIVQAIILVWILAYGVIALRRVYGGSVPRTIAKGAGIALLYAAVAAPVILAVAFIAVST
jgi:hypothetical protein